MYEEIKDTLIEIALTGIKSIIESDRKRETKYNNIRFIMEGYKDVLRKYIKDCIAVVEAEIKEL